MLYPNPNKRWESIYTYSRVQKSIENFVFRLKMAIFQRVGMREGGLPLPLAFQYLIPMIWRACDLKFVMISLLASKLQDIKLRGLLFHLIKWLKTDILTLRTCHFEASEKVTTKFKLQAVHIIRFKYWKAGGRGAPPSLIPAL